MTSSQGSTEPMQQGHGQRFLCTSKGNLLCQSLRPTMQGAEKASDSDPRWLELSRGSKFSRAPLFGWEKRKGVERRDTKRTPTIIGPPKKDEPHCVHVTSLSPRIQRPQGQAARQRVVSERRGHGPGSFDWTVGLRQPGGVCQVGRECAQSQLHVSRFALRWFSKAIWLLESGKVPGVGALSLLASRNL